MAKYLNRFIIEPITPNSRFLWLRENNVFEVGTLTDSKFRTITDNTTPPVYQCVFKKAFPSAAGSGGGQYLYYMVNVNEYDALFGKSGGGGGGGGEGTPENITFLTSVTQTGNVFNFNFVQKTVLVANQ